MCLMTMILVLMVSMQPYIYIIESLFFCQGRIRHRYYILSRLKQQIYFHKRTGNDVAYIVKLKGCRQIRRALGQSATIRHEFSVKFRKLINIIVTSGTEIGTFDIAHLTVRTFRNINHKLLPTVLGDNGYRVTDINIVTGLDKQRLHISAHACRHHCASASRCLQSFVSCACRLIGQPCLLPFALRDDVLISQWLHSLHLAFRSLEGSLCLGNRVAVLQVTCSDVSQSLSASHVTSFRQRRVSPIHYTAYCGSHRLFVTLPSDYLSCRLHHGCKVSRTYSLCLHSSLFHLFVGHHYFTVMVFLPFSFMVMTVMTFLS